MKERIFDILKEVAANPPSMDELEKKADVIISLFSKEEQPVENYFKGEKTKSKN